MSKRALGGSPPHTRGRPRRFVSLVRITRFTPAHAGKTDRRLNHCQAVSVHPRTRGEDEKGGFHAVAASGSPPHTRGRPEQPLPERPLHRFTPAHAGKTCSFNGWSTGMAVHPRTRGEDVAALRVFASAPGSPPHTRGRHGLTINSLPLLCFTPAHAGKTLFNFLFAGGQFLHPRTRGEDTSGQGSNLRHPTSPPHTRGRHATLRSHIETAVFTPAHAGKTLPRPLPLPPVPLHPRTRGEDTLNSRLPRCALCRAFFTILFYLFIW